MRRGGGARDAAGSSATEAVSPKRRAASGACEAEGLCRLREGPSAEEEEEEGAGAAAKAAAEPSSLEVSKVAEGSSSEKVTDGS
jgi:hypothetical protein